MQQLVVVRAIAVVVDVVFVVLPWVAVVIAEVASD